MRSLKYTQGKQPGVCFYLLRLVAYSASLLSSDLATQNTAESDKCGLWPWVILFLKTRVCLLAS